MENPRSQGLEYTYSWSDRSFRIQGADWPAAVIAPVLEIWVYVEQPWSQGPEHGCTWKDSSSGIQTVDGLQHWQLWCLKHRHKWSICGAGIWRTEHMHSSYRPGLKCGHMWRSHGSGVLDLCRFGGVAVLVLGKYNSNSFWEVHSSVSLSGVSAVSWLFITSLVKAAGVFCGAGPWGGYTVGQWTLQGPTLLILWGELATVVGAIEMFSSKGYKGPPKSKPLGNVFVSAA